jgi:hypothetical protein
MNQGASHHRRLDLDRVLGVSCIMNSVQTAVMLKRFEAPDAVRVLEKDDSN